jgi:hypothetical protein
MANLNHSISADFVREILSYDPETGEFRWKWRDDIRKCDNARLVGKVAGSLDSHGYIVIGINLQIYQAHRLAWLHIHGVWPVNQIDHINNDKADNRITNLREATSQENQRNVGLQKNSSTGIAGVSWNKRDQKYQARITVDRKFISLGYFDTLEKAAKARAEAESFYFGEFRRGAA